MTGTPCDRRLTGSRAQRSGFCGFPACVAKHSRCSGRAPVPKLSREKLPISSGEPMRQKQRAWGEQQELGGRGAEGPLRAESLFSSHLGSSMLFQKRGLYPSRTVGSQTLHAQFPFHPGVCSHQPRLCALQLTGWQNRKDGRSVGICRKRTWFLLRERGEGRRRRGIVSFLRGSVPELSLGRMETKRGGVWRAGQLCLTPFLTLPSQLAGDGPCLPQCAGGGPGTPQVSLLPPIFCVPGGPHSHVGPAACALTRWALSGPLNVFEVKPGCL